MPTVIIQKLTSTDGFIVFDLDDAPAVGVTRSAPKILVDGASLLARSLTYRFATFERRIGGASAGVNAVPDARPAALAAYCAEIEPLVRDQRFLTEPAKGVAAEELAPLRSLDSRPGDYWLLEDELTGLGVAVAADSSSGGLTGRSVAVEGFDRSGPALAAALVERGATVVAISTADGTAVDPAGFEPAALAAAWSEHGAGLVTTLGPEARKPWAVFGTHADVLVVGSKPGVIDDQVAAGIRATVVVPSAAVPVTAKGLAVLRRAATVVVPDFVSTAGPLFAGWPAADAVEPRQAAIDAIGGALAEVADHPDGPFLGACLRAEAFLQTWRDTLPFGRPLA
jgi:glutamate dehydrogenase (NAD(P)+)